MPLVDGDRTLRDITVKFKHVTSSDGLVDRVRAKLVGATGFIAKPIKSEKGLAILQQYWGIRN